MRVGFIGHSQLPKGKIVINGIHLDKERVSGASISQAYQPPMVNIIESQPEILIVWLGGNDVDSNSKPAKEAGQELIQLANYCLDFSPEVYLFLIENRDYKDEERNQRYRDKARTVNRYISRKANEYKTFRTINVWGEPFAIDSHDGVHLGPESIDRVISKLQVAVSHATDRLS